MIDHSDLDSGRNFTYVTDPKSSSQQRTFDNGCTYLQCRLDRHALSHAPWRHPGPSGPGESRLKCGCLLIGTRTRWGAGCEREVGSSADGSDNSASRNISKVPATRSWFPGELPPVHTLSQMRCSADQVTGAPWPSGGRSCAPQTTPWPASACEVEALWRGGQPMLVFLLLNAARVACPSPWLGDMHYHCFDYFCFVDLLSGLS